MIWLLALQLAMTPQENYKEAASAVARMDLARAEGDLQAALAGDPYLLPALKLRADLALFAGRPEIARTSLITAVVGNPSSADAHLSLGIFYFTQGNFSSAVPPLQQAHSLSPGDPRPLLYLGRCFEATAKTAEASLSYQQAEDLSPPDSRLTAQILTAYGRLLASEGKYQASIAMEQGAVRLDRSSREAHYELGRALALAHSWKEAAAEGELGLTLPPAEITDTQLHLFLGTVYPKLKPNDRSRGPQSVHLPTSHLTSE